MIITRTPFRISFFGGGTDYPAWYRQNGGEVLAAAIDKYCYITCRRLPPFFDHKHRIVYSKIENVREIDEIRHPAVREVLRWAKERRGLEIHHDGDLPARSGLGSSSSFTVGLVHALRALRGEMVEKEALAREATHIEQDLIGETVGSQDQISAAVGGFNHIRFHRNGAIDIVPVILPKGRISDLCDRLMLFFTGISRFASDVAKTQVDNFCNREYQLQRMQGMVGEALEILKDDKKPLTEFGRLLHETWELKRTLSCSVSNAKIDEMYERARAAGAVGGKLLGAGGGGFFLVFAESDVRPSVREALKDLVYVPFAFDYSGSRVVLYRPNGFY